jgi:hypothetical protein
VLPSEEGRRNKKRKHEERRQERNKKRVKIRDEASSAQSAKKSAKEGWPCTASYCTRILSSEDRLKQHLANGQHSSGKNPFRRGKAKAAREKFLFRQDLVKESAVRRATAAKLTAPIEEHEPPMATAGVGRAPGTVHWLPVAGWAHKPKRSSGRRYTAGQLEFLRACYQRGVDNKKDKLSAETAEYLMRIHGTAECAARFPSAAYWAATATGNPTFRWAERLDKWAIKPWFSQQKAAFENKLKKQAAVAAADLSVDNAIEDDEDDD